MYPRASTAVLFHELNLDRDFRLVEGVTDPLIMDEIRPSFSDAYWGLLLTDLYRDPPHYARVRPVLAQICCRTQGIAPVVNWASSQTFVHDQIAALGLLEDPGLPPILELMAKADSTATARPTAFAAALRFLLNSVCKSLLYITNLRFEVLVSYSTKNGIAFERETLQMNPGLAFDITCKWLKDAHTVEWDGLTRPALSRLVQGALLRYIAAPLPITRETCPETFSMDFDRLVAAQREFHFLANMMVVCQHVSDAANIRHLAEFFDNTHPQTISCADLIHDVENFLHRSGLTITKPKIKAIRASQVTTMKARMACYMDAGVAHTLSENSLINDPCYRRAIARFNTLSLNLAPIIKNNFAVHVGFYIQYFGSLQM